MDLKSVMGVFAVMVLLYAMLIFVVESPVENRGEWFVSPVPGATTAFTVTSAWEENGTVSGLNSDGIIWPDQNQMGTWTSDLLSHPNSSFVSLGYGADARDGSGNWTVRAWNDDPAGGQPPDEVQVFDIVSGDIVAAGNMSRHEYYEIVLSLGETAGSNNQRPHVEYVTAEFDIGPRVSRDFVATWFKYIIVFLLLLYLFFYLLGGGVS